ncbi:hypothetical protein [Bosea psychrotolerans]|uniref:hypothetical protein n=1 Tax=Bosea psychrotolerans TaxID=1871628 RepID=UPI0011B0CBF1|nr:hypothetical protein [Bosea psychrotolerans]
MIDEKSAKQVKKLIVDAMESMSSSLLLINGKFEPDTYESMKRVIGEAIGKLEAEYLVHIYREHPHLDELK